MDEALSTPALSEFQARMAGRLSIGFVLDIGDIGRQDMPLLDALLLHAVIAANVARVAGDVDLQLKHATLDSNPPDELRRPVSVNALAISLNQPFETVRRHINKLTAQAACVLTPAGVYVPAQVTSSPRFVAAQQARYDRIWRFYDDLRAMGAVDEIPFSPMPVDDPRAPVRAVGRILSDYFFRTTDTLHRQVRDPLTGIVLLDVIRISSEHIPPPQAAALMRAGWIPDAARVPANVAQLSRRLGIPYETTRRHVGWLVEQGFCRRVGGGVLAASEFLQGAELMRLSVENLANVRRMYRQIAALGASRAQREAQGQAPAPRAADA